MNEARFWSMIESAWPETDATTQMYAQAFDGSFTDDGVLYELHEQMLARLTAALEQLNAEELLAFDRLLERKLYDIDRADIQEYTDGSDDGFLYCRGFIVSLGRKYYELIKADPSRAVMDAEFEDLCYHALRLYEQKYGPMPRSAISRETGSNHEGW